MLAVILAACGGDDGADGAPGAPGADGKDGVDATAKVDVAALSAEQWAAANLTAEVTSVSFKSPPVVNFKVTDSLGNPVVGLGMTSQSSTAKYPSLANMSFALAKLVPSANRSPSKWVSYIVTTAETTTAAPTPTRPGTDNNGTLVDNKDGTYSYTFRRDVTTMQAQVAAMAASAAAANANNKVEDLGDLSWEPNLPHRLTIQISGAARGTGRNTPTGTQVMPSVNLEKPLNVIYNFIPATGAVIAADKLEREVVAVQNCNTCHEKLELHGGNRFETQYCVVCHTSQRKYGYANVASVNAKFPALTETTEVDEDTGITTYEYEPETRVADGEVIGDFPTLIHKVHSGNWLVKSNYNYENVLLHEKDFSMIGGGQKMCTICHDNTKAVNADNFGTMPTRAACGACHDGIVWATGGGSTIADKRAATAVGAIPATSGHVGKAQDDDTTCYLCHDAAAIKVSHQTENITKHNPAIATGLATFTYEIKSAAVNATTNDVTVVFRIKQDGTALTSLGTAATGAPTGFTAGPSFLLAWSAAQDNIETPVDYNNTGRTQQQAISVSFANLLKGTGGTISATPDGSGYFTATLKGTAGTNVFPLGATMRAVAINGYYTQSKGTGGIEAATGRHAISVVKEVTGDTVRRKVVDSAKCSNCHEWFEGHGGNRVYEVQVCVMCHVPGMATSGRGIPDSILNTFVFDAAQTRILEDWKFDKTVPNAALAFPVTTNNFKDMIHSIHAGRLGGPATFMDARDATSRNTITLLDYRRKGFPGKLNNCETCHLGSTSADKTYNKVPANTLLSTYESIDAAYATAKAAGTATPALAKAALAKVSDTDTVMTPYAAACFSCHNRDPATAHINSNGGVVKGTRDQARSAEESCTICHGPGKEADTLVVHK